MLDSKLNKLIEASCMSFMGENKLRVNMHPSDQVNLKLTWKIEASCILFMHEAKLEENMHVSNSNRI